MEGAAVALKEEVVELEVEVEAAVPPRPREGLNEAAPPPFLTKTFEMVEDPGTDAVVSWGPAQNSFVVWDAHAFATTLLPKYFKHGNFSSFIRQLNTYLGFRKVDPDRWEFANEAFLGGQKHLLKNIRRRRNAAQSLQHHGAAATAAASAAGGGACVEVGRFGLDAEVDHLRRDRSVLMLEIVRLRQQQESSRKQLAAMETRLQGTEKKQRQMMAFLARALKNPSFLHQLVQGDEQRRQLQGAGRKRRLPANPEPEDLPGADDVAVSQEVETLLAALDGGEAMLGAEQGREMTMGGAGDDGPHVGDINDALWEEILNQEYLPAAEEEDRSEVDVEVEELAARPYEWGEDVEDLVEQMAYLVSKQP